MTLALLKAGALGGAALMAALATSGCASHDFVRDQTALMESRVETHVGKVEGSARDALDRANAAHKLAEGKFLYQVVLSDDSVKFPSDRHALSPEAEARISELAERLKAENHNVYLEIQGHTDAVGSPDYNDKLGEARAEAVRRALNHDGVALNRMATVSYGEESPVASNATPDGRAQNRRVVIIVLS